MTERDDRVEALQTALTIMPDHGDTDITVLLIVAEWIRDGSMAAAFARDKHIAENYGQIGDLS